MATAPKKQVKVNGSGGRGGGRSTVDDFVPDGDLDADFFGNDDKEEEEEEEEEER